MQDALVSRMADASLVVYPGIGHSPHWEDPPRVAADVAAFVERICLSPG
jgi:pimeloyl-ACP methyl ester carboxylesterase